MSRPTLTQASGPAHTRILGIGGVRGETVVTNDEVAGPIDSSDEWIRQRTGNDPGAILPGYNLAGTSTGGTYLDLAFVAPLGVAAMVDASNQSWLDSIWDTTVANYGAGYYQDTVALLSLITMSGNWWSPEAAPCP